MVLPYLMGLLIFMIAMGVLFLLVPWERMKKLIGVGLVGGLGVAIVLVYLMQAWDYWEFHRVDIMMIGIPLFLSLAWVPIIMVYSHLLSQYRRIPLLLLTIVTFPTAAVLVHYVLLNNRMLTYHRWNLLLTFLVSLGIHLGVAGYLYVTKRIENVNKIF